MTVYQTTNWLILTLLNLQKHIQVCAGVNKKHIR